MANISTSTTASSPDASELEALVALINRLTVASSEATRLAAEVQSKLPMALNLHSTRSTTWVRAAPKTPAEVERQYPEGSGETWYVVIRGREPGLYRTSDEANAQTNGVPNQYRHKKTSRREALAFYRENYLAATNAANAPAAPPGSPVVGVQKWVEVPHDSLV
ncbi:hypothetical protein DFH09DRAFT_1103140 [Mycena vulgaris]|nr:hypothetical protein DFH09DRAFT_1103140 [Mycena vulgaris]